MKVLAGDIGGTKTLLCLAEVHPPHVEVLHEQRYPSGQWPGLDGMLEAFLDGAGGFVPAAAGFGVAGPVGQDQVKVTNLPWTLDRMTLARQLGCPVRLVNDFAAVAHGIPALRPEQLAELQAGTPRRHGVQAVIGAGTGLGHAILLPRGEGVTVLSSELGHAEFAPDDERQLAVWHWLRERFGRASWEQVVSGPGLAHVARALRESGLAPEAAVAAALDGPGDPAAALTDAALSGDDPLAAAALDLFLRAYGAQAGNLALACIPQGGLFVAGGIAPRLLPLLREGPFLAAFRRKGPMAALMETIPVRVVLEPRVGLLGAALAATA